MGPLAAAIAVLALQSASETPTPEPTNVVLLFADDQRTDTVGAWGNRTIRTPNLDRLVKAGFSFRRTYCMGSPHGAVCQPSRAMLHTGVAYHTLDLSTFDGRPTLGSLLRDAGYDTFATGKWHNGRETFVRSFDTGRAVMFGGMSDHTAVPISDFDGETFSETRTGEKHSSELFADAAVEFLTTRDSDAPFFLYAAFTAPHDPRDPPLAMRDMYMEERPPLPDNFLPQHPFDTGFLTVRDEDLAPWPRTEDVVRDQLAEYYALITHLDTQIGRILDALDATGRTENTLIVYAADHGLAMGSHGLLGKQSLYEHSMRAPLILNGRGIPRGSSSALAYLHDVFPTVLTFVGIEPPESDSSTDLSPVWRGRASSIRDDVFTSMGRTQRALTEKQWKLIRYPKIDKTQLFDLRSDPDELNDVSANPEHAKRIAKMRRKLEAWQERVGDELAWTADEVGPAEVDLTGHERHPDGWQPDWIRRKYFGE